MLTLTHYAPTGTWRVVDRDGQVMAEFAVEAEARRYLNAANDVPVRTPQVARVTISREEIEASVHGGATVPEELPPNAPLSQVFDRLDAEAEPPPKRPHHKKR
jgi:hypothetical protein